jgi:signal transduction histidine kinase
MTVELHRLAGLQRHAERMQDTISEMRSFVAYASHELRTPLTSIKLRVEALRNGALEDPPFTDKFLSEIESEVNRLSRMVNDLLDLSRIEAGLEASKMMPLNLKVVTAEVYDTYRARAQRAGVKMSYSSDADIPLILGEGPAQADVHQPGRQRHQIYAYGWQSVDLPLKCLPDQGKVEFTGYRIWHRQEHPLHISTAFMRGRPPAALGQAAGG